MALRRIWHPPPREHRFLSLADEARRWAVDLPRNYERLGRPFQQVLLDAAIDACRDLVRDQDEVVVLHQDLHGGNVLRAEREPWLVVDPKPLVGEWAFDVASLVRDRRHDLMKPGGDVRVRRRLDVLVDELGLDRERMRLWSLVHALAWGVEDEGDQFDPELVHVAWLLRMAK